jgi:hypothetical protein
MGLDQVAGWTDPQPLENVVNIDGSNFHTLNDTYEWRKHSRLQTFMQALFVAKNAELIQQVIKEQGGKDTEVPDLPVDINQRREVLQMLSLLPMMQDFNCKEVELEKEDILVLKNMTQDNDLPFCNDGFFWGQQFQEEAMKEYKEQDLEFCSKALQWIEEGKKVYYSPWW